MATRKMTPVDFWKNFRLGEELSISGAFIYNGLRQFYSLKKLDNADELFEVLYPLSVGFERLLKIAIVLLEHQDDTDQDKLERSLITHNHSDLLRRVRKVTPINLTAPHNEFLDLLGTFYNSHRYDRFSLSSLRDLDKEKKALLAFLGKYLKVKFEDDSFFGTCNEDRYKKFLHKVATKISSTLYKLIDDRATTLGIYTYEVRSGSKAETVFLGEADMHGEDVLWKELLIFLMNTKSTSGYLDFLRSIEPLEFDPELVGDYLDCFQSDSAKAFVIDELEHLYEGLKKKGERIKMMSVIGAPGIMFDTPGVNDDEEDES